MDEKVSKKLLNLDRNVLTQIIHSISGHNNIRYFSNETKLLKSTSCRLCKDKTTQEHISFDCKAMTVLKYEVYKKYISYNKDNRNWSVEMIIYFINNEHINLLSLRGLTN